MTFEYKPEEYKYVKQDREKLIHKFMLEAKELGMNSFSMINVIKNLAIQEAIEGSTKEYLSFDFGRTAYTHQIDNYCKPNESIEFAHNTVCPEADPAWVKEAKNYGYGFNEHLIKLLIEDREGYFNNLPEQINLNTLKKDVGNSRSLNQGLRKLYGYQKIEKEMTEMKARIAALEAAQTNSRIDIELVKLAVDCPSIPPKTRAKVMRDKGCTIKAIAKELGVHRNTVKRWLEA